jgi:hypothetical protein
MVSPVTNTATAYNAASAGLWPTRVNNDPIKTWKKGWKEGGWRREGRLKGRKEGWQEERLEGRKVERKYGWQEGRKGGRREGWKKEEGASNRNHLRAEGHFQHEVRVKGPGDGRLAGLGLAGGG